MDIDAKIALTLTAVWAVPAIIYAVSLSGRVKRAAEELTAVIGFMALIAWLVVFISFVWSL